MTNFVNWAESCKKEDKFGSAFAKLFVNFTITW